MVASSSWNSIFSMLNSISTKCPNIHNIVIDDATYIMRTEYFDRSKEKGYDKYSELADHFRKIISLGNSLRNDITVFLMLHSEVVESDGSIIGYKAATIGKLLDKQYNPLESVSITLYAAPKYADNGKPEFGFWTHPMKVNGIEIPAKSPDEMFEEDFMVYRDKTAQARVETIAAKLVARLPVQAPVKLFLVKDDTVNAHLHGG